MQHELKWERIFVSSCLIATLALLLPPAAYAQGSNLVLRGFVDPWPENEVGYTNTPGVQRYWDGEVFSSASCAGCEFVVGSEVQYPVPTAPGQDIRTLFIPFQIWTDPDPYGGSSDDPVRAAMGLHLAELMQGDPVFRVRLGIGDGEASAPDSYFPDDFFSVPSQETSVGSLKLRY